jgi:oxygen-dependent protoporphyrinogen oxidase
VSLAGGTQELVDALVAAIRAMPNVEVRTRTLVESLELEGHGIRIALGGGQRIRPEALILATPAPVAAALLAPVVPDAARHVASIPHGTTAVVNLAYRDDQLPDDLTGHGFLVAGDEPLTISACTLSSRKWAGRAADGSLLVRAFIGSARGAVHDLDDAGLIAAAQGDITKTMGIRGEAILARISRYPAAMPNYTVGHLERVEAAEAALAPFPAIKVAGGAYRGVGLPDCIGQGRAAADAIATLLSSGDGAAVPAVVRKVGTGAPGRPRLTVDGLPIGREATVVGIDPEHGEDLALEGLHPGTEVTVASRAPLGGPLVVGIGRARIAVARKVAAGIAVELAEAETTARAR